MRSPSPGHLTVRNSVRPYRESSALLRRLLPRLALFGLSAIAVLFLHMLPAFNRSEAVQAMINAYFEEMFGQLG